MAARSSIARAEDLFYTEDGVVQAVNGVDFTIREGEVMGLVGESGSGKSVTSLSIMRLLAASGKIVAGEVRFKGRDLRAFPKKRWSRFAASRCP